MTTVFFYPAMFIPHIGNHIKLPEDLEKYEPADYPHWHVFLNLHLGNTVDVTSLEGNAKVIASLDDEEIKTVTLEKLIGKGFYVEHGTYLV